jgi:hypothetical protein
VEGDLAEQLIAEVKKIAGGQGNSRE